MNQQNAEKLITIIGGSGFLGRHIVRALAKRGYRIRVACRRPDLAGHLQPLGVPGQVMPVQANVRYPASLAAACDGAYAVINLTGVLYSAGPQSFDAVHAFGAEASAKAAGRAARRVSSSRCRPLAPIPPVRPPMPQQGRRRGPRAGSLPGCRHPAPVHRLRAGGQFLQPVRGLARFAPALPLIGGGATSFARSSSATSPRRWPGWSTGARRWQDLRTWRS